MVPEFSNQYLNSFLSVVNYFTNLSAMSAFPSSVLPMAPEVSTKAA